MMRSGPNPGARAQRVMEAEMGVSSKINSNSSNSSNNSSSSSRSSMHNSSSSIRGAARGAAGGRGGAMMGVNRGGRGSWRQLWSPNGQGESRSVPAGSTPSKSNSSKRGVGSRSESGDQEGGVGSVGVAPVAVQRMFVRRKRLKVEVGADVATASAVSLAPTSRIRPAAVAAQSGGRGVATTTTNSAVAAAAATLVEQQEQGAQPQQAQQPCVPEPAATAPTTAVEDEGVEEEKGGEPEEEEEQEGWTVYTRKRTRSSGREGKEDGGSEEGEQEGGCGVGVKRGVEMGKVAEVSEEREQRKEREGVGVQQLGESKEEEGESDGEWVSDVEDPGSRPEREHSSSSSSSGGVEAKVTWGGVIGGRDAAQSAADPAGATKTLRGVLKKKVRVPKHAKRRRKKMRAAEAAARRAAAVARGVTRGPSVADAEGEGSGGETTEEEVTSSGGDDVEEHMAEGVIASLWEEPEHVVVSGAESKVGQQGKLERFLWRPLQHVMEATTTVMQLLARSQLGESDDDDQGSSSSDYYSSVMGVGEQQVEEGVGIQPGSTVGMEEEERRLRQVREGDISPDDHTAARSFDRYNKGEKDGGVSAKARRKIGRQQRKRGKRGKGRREVEAGAVEADEEVDWEERVKQEWARIQDDHNHMAEVKRRRRHTIMTGAMWVGKRRRAGVLKERVRGGKSRVVAYDELFRQKVRMHKERDLRVQWTRGRSGVTRAIKANAQIVHAATQRRRVLRELVEQVRAHRWAARCAGGGGGRLRRPPRGRLKGDAQVAVMCELKERVREDQWVKRCGEQGGAESWGWPGAAAATRAWRRVLDELLEVVDDRRERVREQMKVDAWEVECARVDTEGTYKWGRDVKGRARVQVVMGTRCGTIQTEALFDSGAQVSVMSYTAARKGGWRILRTRLTGLRGIAASAEVVGVVQVGTVVQGAGGVVTYAVVRKLPEVLPDVVIGRSALVENRWSATIDDQGVQVTGKQVEAAMVSVVDDEGMEEVVYNAPAFEDVVHEEDGEEVEYMPPAEREEVEVVKEIGEMVEKVEGVQPERKEELGVMLRRRWKVFSNKLGGVKGHTFRIQTRASHPVSRRPYRLTPEKQAEVHRQVTDLLERGILEECGGEWSTNPVLAKKKDGTWRMAIDYRGLNAVTEGDEFPVPRIDEMIDATGKYRVFTTVDMRSGFWQMPLQEEDRAKTAFNTPTGRYRWKVMPFGLKNATSAFQRMMTAVLDGLEGVKCYVDDVLICTESEEGHVELVEKVLQRLEEAGLVCKLSKSEFMKRRVEVLGFVIGEGKVEMQERLVGKVKGCKRPTTKSEVRQFVGLVGFYRHFIPSFADKAAPLTSIMGAKSEWVWGVEQEEAFQGLKAEVQRESVLRVPDWDREFVIHTDASGIGVGAVLMQRDDKGRLYACRFLSRKLNAAERRYSASEREYLAMVMALKRWRPYLGLNRCEVHTDHKPLLSMVKSSDATQSARVQRWGMLLQSFDVRIRYIKGRRNVVADALSRELFVDEEENPASTGERELHELVEAAMLGTEEEWGEEHEEAGGVYPAAYEGEKVVTSQGEVEVQRDGEWEHEATDSEEEEALRDEDWPEVAEFMGLGKLEESDVPGEGTLGVGAKEVEREEEREVEYWEEVRVGQTRDTECAAWIKQVKVGECVKKDGGALEMEDGVLMFRDKQGRSRLVIPSGVKREELLRLVHENPRDGGHFGAVKGASKLQQRWWWPGMVSDLRHWVSTCRKCQIYKHARGRARLPRDTPRVVPRGPWDSVYVDAIGPLAVGKGGYSFCLVAIDHFTRHVEVMPVRRLTTESYVGWLQQLVSRYGVMRRLTSDRGSNFISALVDSYCRVMGIERHSTTAWRPTANSLVERYNGELKDRMRTMSEEVGKDWPSVVEDFAGVHNTTVHASTGFTPFFLMHGFEAKLPYDLLVDGKQRCADEPVEVQKWVERFVQLVSDARSEARQRQGDRDHARQLKAVAIARTVNPPPVFEPGQWVLIDKRHRNPGQKKEATVLWTGPYKVLKRISEIAYLVEREGGREDVVHVDRIKRWRSALPGAGGFTTRTQSSTLTGATPTGSPAATGGGETGFEDLDRPAADGQGEGVSEGSAKRWEVQPDEDARAEELTSGVYEVEAILAKRVLPDNSRLTGQPLVEYYVKYKNWDDTHNTWERAANLEGSPDLLKRFEEAELVRGRAHRARRRAQQVEDFRRL